MQLWLLDPAGLSDPEAYARAHDMLSPAEVARASRFLREADRHNFLGGRLLARTALGALLSESPRTLDFVLGPHGKPALGTERERRVAFNVSHTRGLVACAVTSVGDIGVDVEVVRSAPLDVAVRFFAPPEIETLRLAPSDEQADTFCRIWTLKEAFVKACGGGLSMGLNAFAVGLTPPAMLRFGAMGDDAAGWHFTLMSPTAAHRLAICVSGTPSEPPDVVTRWLTL